MTQLNITENKTNGTTNIINKQKSRATNRQTIKQRNKHKQENRTHTGTVRNISTATKLLEHKIKEAKRTYTNRTYQNIT